MTDLDGSVKRTDEWGMTVIRADGTVEPLGTVASSAWRWYTPARWRAWRRIKYLNAKHGHWRAFLGLPDR